MKSIILVLAVGLMVGVQSVEAGSRKWTEKEQHKLDRLCEEARQEAMVPIKREIFSSCLKKHGKKSEERCTKEADHYNGNRVGGAPRFYDLPACERAFNYKKKSRNL